MYPKYNICTGTFGHGTKAVHDMESTVQEKDGPMPKLLVEKLRLSSGK
jgi:hypothetical protein